MKAIQTRYLGPTTHRPARVKAWAEGVPAVVLSVHDLDQHGQDVQRAAAEALCERMSWSGDLASGTLPNGDGCHVFAERPLARLGPLSVTIERHPADMVLLDVWHTDCPVGLATLRLDREGAHHDVMLSAPALGDEALQIWATGEELPE